MSGWARVASKSVQCLLMGAIFVVTVNRVVPARKRASTVTAFAMVVLWSALLMLAAFPKGVFVDWLFVMELSGLLGGALALRFSSGTRGCE